MRYGHVEVVKLLVECGAGKPDFNLNNYLLSSLCSRNFQKHAMGMKLQVSAKNKEHGSEGQGQIQDFS